MAKEKDHPDFSYDQVRLQLADSSKALSHLTANMVYDEPSLFRLLLDMALSDERLYAQRASRIVCICSSRFPELFQPHCTRVVRELKNIHNEGAIRNLLKIMAEVPLKLTNRDKSILINLCFDYLVSDSFPVAIHVFSMEVLFKLSHDIPEIAGELFRILEEKMPDASAGFKSRANKILQKGKSIRHRILNTDY